MQPGSPQQKAYVEHGNRTVRTALHDVRALTKSNRLLGQIKADRV